MPRPLGRWAKAQIKAISLAEAMTALAIAASKREWAVEDELSLPMTYEQYAKALTSAERNGTIDEFNERLRQIIQPLIAQVFAPQEQGNGP